jgi:hypothetical protein
MKKTILPPLKLPVIKEGSVSSKDTPTPKTELRFIATARTKNIYKCINVSSGNYFLDTDLTEQFNNILKDPEFLTLSKIERTDFCTHLLQKVISEKEILSVKKTKRNYLIKQIKSDKTYKEYRVKRNAWKNWKNEWYNNMLKIGTFIIMANVDLISLKSLINKADISLEHTFLWILRHHPDKELIDKLKTVDLEFTDKIIRSYHRSLTMRIYSRMKRILQNDVLIKKIFNYEQLKRKRRHWNFGKKLEIREKSIYKKYSRVFIKTKPLISKVKHGIYKGCIAKAGDPSIIF